jgi:protein strawberry notch
MTLIRGTEDLVHELVRRLNAGESFDNLKLNRLADKFFGGIRAKGTYTSSDSYDALETAVNKLLLETMASRSELPVLETLTELRDVLSRLPGQTSRTTEQIEFQQFSTPPTISFIASRLTDLQPGDVVLEPSAGTGSLAIWARLANVEVVCNEINPRRRFLLQDILGFNTFGLDAEMIDDVLPCEITPTVVLINPPFTGTGGRVVMHRNKYGLLHIDSALRRLRDGGRLVAIASEAVAFSRPGVTGWWQQLATKYAIRANFGLSGTEYKKYGTTWGIQFVVIDKVGPTPGGGWKDQLSHIVWGQADTLEQAWESLCKLPLRTVPDVHTSQASEEQQAADSSDAATLFLPYVPAKLKGGKPHPAVIVESASMASVTPPNITYRPHLPLQVVTEGKLSEIQLERAIYAGQRHEQRLSTGARSGFYVGDGTGVGKGRILAGIVLDNWLQGRRRALWLSVNNDLLESSRRDLNDLGVHIPLARINDYSPNEDILLPEGVIFSSYSSLISSAKTGEKRLDQIQRWLGPEPVVIFDEAHKAKNALASGRGEATQTGQAVIDLQDPEHNPEYRVVYSSATGATDVRNMAYMTRLGLWGPGTSFPDGFQQFLAEIDSGGVGAMEMVSRDMKSLGIYLSGSISFGADPQSGKCVEYRERVHRLTPEQRTMYNRAAAAWRVILQNIDEALAITNSDRRARGIALNRFWGDHQRFFRQLICAFKVPSVIAEAEVALQAGKSAVISLVGTGEAKTREQIARLTAEGGSLEDLDFSPREIIAALIERGFPTQLYQDQTDAASGRTIQVPVVDEAGNRVQSQEALRMKQALLDKLSAVHLPENPLDQLVNHFGEANVAELTGRSRRLIRDPLTGKVEYKKRAPEGVPMNRVNVHGMEQFQGGRCRVAIISDAGSLGISLHASNRAVNRERRVHITLELGWSADKQMQCFGRTHRSDQSVPPEYVLLSTELGGEKRFSSTIARRLASLGALTKGDRSAADNADWARYNFETQEGKAALGLLYKRIVEGEAVSGLDDPRQTLRNIGLLVIQDGVERIRKEDEHNVPRFLNRILALEVDEQNALFNYFADLFDQTVRYAKTSGTFDEGVTDIKALAIRIARPPAVVHRDHVTGAETVLYTLEVDRPSDKVSFDRADRLRTSERGAFFQHESRGDFVLALPSGRHTDPDNGRTFLTYSIWKPGGARTAYLREEELNTKYGLVTSPQARSWWERQYSSVPEIETREVRIIGGAIIPLWQKLKTKDDARLKVVRVSTADGQRIVGVEIPRSQVGRVLCALGLKGPSRDASQIFHDILDGGELFTLAGGLKLKRSALQREPVVEVECHDSDRFEELRKLGLINEQIRYKQHFFVPADEERGISILTELLGRHPVVPEESGEPEDIQQEILPVEVPATEASVIDLPSWILPPAENAPRILTPADAPPIASTDIGPSCEDLVALRNRLAGTRRHRSMLRVDEQQVLFAFD